MGVNIKEKEIKKFVATFFSHFGAIKFKKALSKIDVICELSPVPRMVSSSCGTCAVYESDIFYPLTGDVMEEIDKIFERISDNEYKEVYCAED